MNQLHDPRPLPTVPAWRVIAALVATALLLWISDEDQTATTSTSPDPLTFPANHEGDNTDG